MTRLPLTVLLVAALVLLPVMTGCGGGDEDETGATTTPTVSRNANDHGTRDFSDESSGEVELGDDYFAPTVIEGKAGQSLTLELRNEGNSQHNFTTADQSIDADVGAGEDVKVKVEIPQSRAVGFFCKYHLSQGMAGSLAVSSGSGRGSSGSGSSGSGSSGGTTTQSDDSRGGYGY